MARPTFVKRARKDNPAVKRGESYFWWKFRYGGKHYSKERPRASQLTQSEFLGLIYGVQEDIEDAKPETREDLRSLVEGWTSQIREAGEEQASRREEMPESLQDGPTGEMMQTRCDEADAWADELDAVDLDDELDAALEELRETSYNGE